MGELILAFIWIPFTAVLFGVIPSNEGSSDKPIVEDVAQKLGVDRFNGDPQGLERIGWHAQDVQDVAPYEDTPFVGFGSCPYEPQGLDDLEKIRGPMEAIMFYLVALRTQCSQVHVIQLMDLFNQGLLTLNGDKSLSIPKDNLLMKMRKLTMKEEQALSKAFEMSMFSHVLSTELRKPSSQITAPDGSKIDRSIFTTVSMALHSMTESRRNAPAHYILLTRKLLSTLKAARLKAIEAHRLISECAECSVDDKEVALNNVLSLKAIHIFITRSHSLAEKGADLYAAYEYFYRKNKDYIRKMIDKKEE